MNYANHYRVILTVLIFSIFLLSATVSADASNETNHIDLIGDEEIDSSELLSLNDGYIDDDTEGVRIVDFTIASTDVPSKSYVESELIVANYGLEEETDITLRPKITDESGEDIDEEDYKINPTESYDGLDLEPGEHKVFNFDLRFEEENEEYTVSFVNEDEPDDDNRLASKDINVRSEGSQVGSSLLIDRKKANANIISTTRFKDESVERSTSPGAYLSMPPTELDEDGDIIELDAATGSVIDFSNIRGSSDSSTLIENTDGEINVGFSSESIPSQEYYAVSIIYELNNMDSIEVSIVDSTGEEIDENTSYYLTDESDREQRDFHLSEEEIDYINNQQESYIEFKELEGSGSSQSIDLYDIQTIALDDIWNMPEPELRVSDMSISNTEPQAGESISIEADIINEGNSAYNDNINIYETLVGNTNSTIDSSDNIVINPGETKSVSYSIPISNEELHEFKILSESMDVNVDGIESDSIYADIYTSTDSPVTGEEIEFRATGLSSDEIEDIESFEWRFDSDEGYSETGEEVTHSYDESDTYSVRLRITYENSEGDMQETVSQTAVDVMSGTEPDIRGLQYDFNVDGSERKGSQTGSSVSTNVASGTCSVNCGGRFEFDNINLPLTSGVNMLVFDTDREESEYNPIFYGTYDVDNNIFASTTEITDSGLSDVREDIDNMENTGANTALESHISSYEGDDNYFMFVGGGNPNPLDASVITQLENIGSNSVNNIEEDSMWLFATQTLENGQATPLHESHMIPDGDTEKISHFYSLEPVEIDSDTEVIPNRPIYFDLENSNVATGDLENSDIEWEYNGNTETNEEYVSTIYNDGSEDEVSATIVDENGFSGTSTETFNSESVSPESSFSTNIQPELNSDNIFNPIGSYDKDSTIQTYTWTVEDSNEVYEGINPNISWDDSGTYDLTLTVADNYGNTDSTTKTIDVEGSPPSINTDIRRVSSDFNTHDNTDIDTPIDNDPILYYPFNLAEGITEEYAQGLDLYSDSISTDEGITSDSNSIRIDENSDLEIDEEPITELDNQFTISTWVNTDNQGTIYSVMDDSVENYITLRYWDSGPDFNIGSQGEESEGLDFETDIADNTWNHIAATYSSSEGLKLYVNGELEDETDSTVDELDIDESVFIGADSRDDFAAGSYDGLMSDLQLYNAELSASDIDTIKSQESELMIDEKQQGLIYDFGNSYNTISTNEELSDGSYSVQEENDHYVLTANSEEQVDSSAYLTVEDINMDLYDTIHITYDTETVSEEQEEIGHISMHTTDGDEVHEEKAPVKSYQNSKSNGILEIDTSEITEQRDIHIESYSVSDSESEVNVELYEVWGETEGEDNNISITDWNEELYPDRSDDMYAHVTRDSIRFSNTGDYGTKRNIAMLQDDSTDVTVDYDIELNSENSDGVNLYHEENNAFEFGASLESPESIFCSQSIVLDSNCEETGDSTDKVDITESTVNQVGVDKAISNGHILVNSFYTDTQGDDNMYPKVKIDASDSEGAGSDVGIEKYEWDLNPDSSFSADSTGAEFKHEFNNFGTNEIELKTTDTLGETNTEIIEITVDNLRPDLDIDIPEEIETDTEYMLNAGVSTGDSSDIENVMWDMGNGDIEYGSEISYTYENSGSYDITVTAVDSTGLTDVYSESVDVE